MEDKEKTPLNANGVSSAIGKRAAMLSRIHGIETDSNGQHIPKSEYVWPVWSTTLDQMGEYGVGIELFFRISQALIVLFLVLAGIMTKAQTEILEASICNGCETNVCRAIFKATNKTEEEYCEYRAKIIPADIRTERDTAILATSLGHDNPAASEVAAWNLLVVAVLCLFCFVLRRIIVRYDFLNNKRNVTSADYTLHVKGIPEHAVDEDHLKEFVQDNFGTVANVAISLQCRDMVVALKKRMALDQQKELLEAKQAKLENNAPAEDSDARKIEENDKALEKTKEKITDTTKKIVELDEKIGQLDGENDNSTGQAFVTFEQEGQLAKCAKAYKRTMYNQLMWFVCCCMQGKCGFPKGPPKYHDVILKTERAPEPSDVYWENLECGIWSTRIRVAATYVATFLVLGMSTGALVGFQAWKSAFSEDLAEDFAFVEQPDCPCFEQCVNITGFPDDFINTTMPCEQFYYEEEKKEMEEEMEWKTSFNDTYYNVTEEEDECSRPFDEMDEEEREKCRPPPLCDAECQLLIQYTIIKAFLTVFGTVVITGINMTLKNTIVNLTQFERLHTVTDYEQSLFKKVSIAYLLNNVVLIMLVNHNMAGWYASGGVAMQAFYLMVSNCIVPFVLTGLQPFAYLKQQGAKNALTQAQMNSLYAAPTFFLGEKFASLIKTVGLGLFYGPLLPSAYVMTALTVFLDYWVTKYALLRVFKKPAKLDADLPEGFREVLGLLIAGHIILGSQVYTDSWNVEPVLGESTGGVIWEPNNPGRSFLIWGLIIWALYIIPPWQSLPCLQEAEAVEGQGGTKGRKYSEQTDSGGKPLEKYQCPIVLDVKASEIPVWETERFLSYILGSRYYGEHLAQIEEEEEIKKQQVAFKGTLFETEMTLVTGTVTAGAVATAVVMDAVGGIAGTEESAITMSDDM